MMVTGAPVADGVGAEIGLVDAVADEDVVDVAVAFLREQLSSHQMLRVTGATSVPLEGDEDQVIVEARSTLDVPPGRRRAAGRIVDCVEALRVLVSKTVCATSVPRSWSVCVRPRRRRCSTPSSLSVQRAATARARATFRRSVASSVRTMGPALHRLRRCDFAVSLMRHAERPKRQ